MNKKSIIHLVTKTNEDATKVLFSCRMFAVKLCDTRALFIFCKYIYNISTHALGLFMYESFATVGESRVWWRADFQSGSRVLRKVF